MKKKNLIISIIVVIIAGVIFYWAYGIFQKRSDQNSSLNFIKESLIKKDTNSTDNSNISGETNLNSNQNQNENENGNSNLNENGNTNLGYLNVTSKDCDNKCANFKQEDQVNYCKNVCGLSSYVSANQNTNNGDCSNLQGLNKDYCLKDLAITKNNFNLCQQISDPAIKKVCRNRIMEDVIN